MAAVLLPVLAACASDGRGDTTAPAFDVARVVQVESVSCANRVGRGQAVRLGEGAYLTAAHTVADARQILIDPNIEGATTEVVVVSIDHRSDLALLHRPPDDPPEDVSLDGLSPDEWVDVDPNQPATIVSARQQRNATVSAVVIVRAHSPDGTRREWRGIRIGSSASPGESGSAVVQGGRLIGMIVQTERGEERSWSVASEEIRNFLFTPVQPRNRPVTCS